MGIILRGGILMNLLFITSRNIYSTNGELRLIKNRANVLYEKFGIVTDFICYHDDDVLHEEQELINNVCDFTLITYSKKNPFTLFVNKNKVIDRMKEMLNTKSYDAVIISGEFALQYVTAIKKLVNIPVVYDVHGATNELIEFRGSSVSNNVFRRLLFILLRYYEKRNAKKFDAAFVVTEELKNHVISNFSADNLKFFIIPCAKKYSEMKLDTYFDLRKKYRDKYNISDDARLFIYSGGISPWQCIDKTVDLFEEISKEIGNCKFLLLSDQAKKLEVNNDDIITDTLPYNMVDETLCAGDFAFMLRDDLVTNHVAFPNKYCEYIASGMKIITSPYLKTVAKNIDEHELGYVMSGSNDVKGVVQYVKDNKSINVDMNKRYEVLKSFEFERTLVPFVEYLKGELNEG